MMTIEQQQHLLAYLGYYDSDVDGLWGPKSTQATKDFQTDFGGLEVTGKVDDTTAKALTHAVAYGMLKTEKPTEPDSEPKTFWDEIEIFAREEFRCQCNGKYCDGIHVEPEETMVRICDEIRRRAGVPILIRDAGGSGLRCPEWNAQIPGAAANSYHTKGMAADLHPRGKTPEQL